MNVQFKATTLNSEIIKDQSALTHQVEMVVPEQNPIIKNLKVENQDNHYIVSGKARPTTGLLYYLVEDGHHEWVAERELKVKSKYPKWSDFSFELTIQEGKYPDRLPLIISIYEKDNKGNMIHTYQKMLTK